MTDFNRDTSNMGSSSTGTMTGTRRWDDYRDTYRSDWENRFGKDRPWSEHEDAYRFGWQAGQNNRWQGKNWDDAQSDLENEWPNRSQWSGDGTGSHQGHDMSAH